MLRCSLALSPPHSPPPKDVVTIVSGLVASHQLLGLADFLSSMQSIDGGIGLGWANSYNMPPLWQTLYEQKQISQRVFTYWASQDLSRAEISFGGINTNRYTDEITYYPRYDSDFWWAIEMNGVTWNGNQACINHNETSLCISTFEMGLQFIYGPYDTICTINEDLGCAPVAGLCKFLICPETSKLPTVKKKSPLHIPTQPTTKKKQKKKIEFSIGTHSIH
eukprot:TRINITY_DN2526_c0_g1_i2.p1 TRINITY_DN2526_c0_g1~~TRINITY_DN2526_c0_g1_i2.p1  ORF type:complete len:221 (-),score=38.17 TRINITY_DN2526_c0_g1_i2:285-947(-)